MSSLTTEQLVEMTKRANERLAEFEIPAGIGVVTKVPRGVVRVLHDVIMEFWEEDAPPAQKPSEMYVAGVQKGRAEALAEVGQRDNLHHNGHFLLSDGAVALGGGVRVAVESLTQGKLDGSPADALAAAWPTLADLAVADVPDANAETDDVAPQNRDEKLTEVEGIKARAYEVIRGLAEDGVMPRQSDYDAARPEGLPGRMRLSQITGMNWSEMAAELGLTVVPPHARALQRKAEIAQQEAAVESEPEAEPVGSDEAVAEPTRAEPAPKTEGRSYEDKYAEVRRKMRERAYEFIASIAVEGRMPLEDDYNAKRPTTVPSSRDMMNRLGFATWREVAEDVGLKWPPKPRQ